MIFHSVPDFEFAAVPPRHGPDIYSLSILSFLLSFRSLCFGRERRKERLRFWEEKQLERNERGFFLFSFFFPVVNDTSEIVDLFLSMSFCFYVTSKIVKHERCSLSVVLIMRER